MSGPTRVRATHTLGALFLLASPSAAQDAKPIQDNSFLLEEAYNQEHGVVQHISTFARPNGGGAWGYSFTQEWPVGGIRHQLSYTVPVVQVDGLGTGVGDVLLNYRYQARRRPGRPHLVRPPRVAAAADRQRSPRHVALASSACRSICR